MVITIFIAMVLYSLKSGLPRISFRRVSAVVVPLALVAGGVAYLLAVRASSANLLQRSSIDQLVLSSFGLGEPVYDRLDPRFVDSDGDLVADPPQDATNCITPDPLVFSYIAGDNAEQDAEFWSDFTAHLQRTVERPVKYFVAHNVKQQLEALQTNQLHVTGFNSGAIPLAVNTCGFVPVCTYADGAGNSGYRMQIVVRRDSSTKRVEDLKGREIAFTHLSSNSGFKAAFVLLQSQYHFLPERDYQWAFSGGHQTSLKALTAGKYDAAALASDLIEQAVREKTIDGNQLRVVYESERFPTAGLGYVNTLEPALAARVREALLSYKVAESPLVKYFGPNATFVPITFKDDWATIRRIDELFSKAGQEPNALPRAKSPGSTPSTQIPK